MIKKPLVDLDEDLEYKNGLYLELILRKLEEISLKLDKPKRAKRVKKTIKKRK